MLALQVLLGGYLVVDSQDPILLDPESGSLEEDGLNMVMLYGRKGHTPEGRLSEVLSKMPLMETSAGGSEGGLCGAVATSGTTTMSSRTRTPTKSA
jgi:hypothetical protein